MKFGLPPKLYNNLPLTSLCAFNLTGIWKHQEHVHDHDEDEHEHADSEQLSSVSEEANLSVTYTHTHTLNYMMWYS